MISSKSFADTTAAPSIASLTSIDVSIPISRSDAANVKRLSCTVKRIPLSMGMVVRVDTAFDTMFSAFERAICVQVNFMAELLFYIDF